MKTRLTLFICMLIGCSKAPSKEVVVMGGVLPQTGSAPAPSWIASAKLAFDDANAGLSQAGGLLQFDFKAADSTGSGVVAAARAIDLVKKSGAKGIITDLSSVDQTIHALNY